MTVKNLLDLKRQGGELAVKDIREFIAGFTAGAVPDYQVSAFAMAVCCKGMSVRETAALTDAMMRSGEILDWGEGLPTADKHSTGGVGDKLSLVIQPLASCCGLRVPSLSGRALGHTGGTIDKMESIPGFNATLSLGAFRDTVNKTGVSISAQTSEICPADCKMYALRDVTGTVASIPLITASILSKKLAEGARTLVFDVKCGAGAFMKTREEARALAASLVDSAKKSGRSAAALVTRMSSPLGRAVGNANEVVEAVKMLSQPHTDPLLAGIEELCVEFAARMVSLAKGISLDDARKLANEKLLDGSAYTRFREMVAAQGGDLDGFLDRYFEMKPHRFRVSAMRSGFVTGIDPIETAMASLELGAGRFVETDKIDHMAAIEFDVAVGSKVAVGAALATLSTMTKPEKLEGAAAKLLGAIHIGAQAPQGEGLIMEEVV